MCLVYDKKETEKLIAKCKKNKKTFVKCYKIVRWNSLLSYVQSYLYNHVWEGGWNHATGVALYKQRELIDEERMQYGIHVYTTKKNVITKKCGYNGLYGFCILPVKCYIKDIIGVSTPFRYLEKEIFQEAVFTKVWVDKKELDKIRRKYVN